MADLYPMTRSFDYSTVLHIFAVLLITTVSLSAQSAFDKATDDVCKCLSDSPDAYTDQNALQTKMQECMQTAFQKDAIKILAEKGVTDPSDPKQMARVGTDLSNALLDKCDSHLQGIKDMQMSVMSSGPKSTSGKAKGKLVSITPGAVTTLIVEDPLGKQTEVLWISKWSGDTELISNPSRYLDQNVLVEYVTTEIYDHKSKTYKRSKELRGISLAQK